MKEIILNLLNPFRLVPEQRGKTDYELYVASFKRVNGADAEPTAEEWEDFQDEGGLSTLPRYRGNVIASALFYAAVFLTAIIALS